MAVGFLALLDDIAVLMDDVAVVAQVAGKKTAGILGDDLAVSANKASGFTASRELPVLWAIGKGSMLNKLIILPIAFLLSAFAPWAIVPILILGGLYLAYEGAEKVYEYLYHKESKHRVDTLEVTVSPEEVLENEKKKIKSAIITDFILSVEIVIIALSTVTAEPLLTQIIVVSLIAFVATVGVYGIVALLVRMDDVGYSLIAKGKEKIGQFLVNALPKVIKFLTVVGTIAMMLVAGGIFVHNIPALHDALHGFPSLLGELFVGAIVGLIVLFFVELIAIYKESAN
jgi:predicted DNA repair protein MutK